jgi:hypothetical protein
MLHGTLEDNGRRDYPDTLLPVEDTSTYEVRPAENIGWPAFNLPHFTTREAAETVAHRINIYADLNTESAQNRARVIEWRLEGGKRVGIAL